MLFRATPRLLSRRRCVRRRASPAASPRLDRRRLRSRCGAQIANFDSNDSLLPDLLARHPLCPVQRLGLCAQRFDAFLVSPATSVMRAMSSAYWARRRVSCSRPRSCSADMGGVSNLLFRLRMNQLLQSLRDIAWDSSRSGSRVPVRRRFPWVRFDHAAMAADLFRGVPLRGDSCPPLRFPEAQGRRIRILRSGTGASGRAAREPQY